MHGDEEQVSPLDDDDGRRREEGPAPEPTNEPALVDPNRGWEGRGNHWID